MGGKSSVRVFRYRQLSQGTFHSVVAGQIQDLQHIIQSDSSDFICTCTWYMDTVIVEMIMYDLLDRQIETTFQFNRYEFIVPQVINFQRLTNVMLHNCRKI